MSSPEVDGSFHKRCRSYYRPARASLADKFQRCSKAIFDALQLVAKLSFILIVSALLLFPASPGFWLITTPMGILIFWLSVFAVPLFCAAVATGTGVAMVAAPCCGGQSLVPCICCWICYLPWLFPTICGLALMALLVNPLSPLFWLVTMPIVAAMGVLYVAGMTLAALLAVCGFTFFSARALLPWGLPAIMLASISLEISIWFGCHRVWGTQLRRFLLALAGFHDALFTLDTSWEKLSAALRDSEQVVAVKVREAQLLYHGDRLTSWQILQRSRMWLKALWQRSLRVLNPFTDQASAVHSDYHMHVEHPQFFCGGWQQELIDVCLTDRPDAQQRTRKALQYPLADPNAPLPCARGKACTFRMVASTEQQRPIHYATRNLKVSIVRELLLFGADPRIKDSTGNSAWELARKKGATGIVEMMDPQKWTLHTHKDFGRCFGDCVVVLHVALSRQQVHVPVHVMEELVRIWYKLWFERDM